MNTHQPNQLHRITTFILTILLAILSIFCVNKAECAEKPNVPNIVLILADDLGYGDLGCFGQKSLKTPRLDAMAKEGMRFTQFYAGSPVCAPSRCVLLTGKHAGRAAIRGNSAEPIFLAPGQPTVASLLKGAGYATACIGKWGVGTPDKLTNPNDVGFDHFFGYVNMWHAHNCYPEFLIRNGRVVPLQNEVGADWKKWQDPKLPQGGKGVAVKRVEYAPELFIDDALRFIREHQKKPFFLYLALNTPHANNEAGDRGMEVPDQGEFAAKDWPASEKGFAAMIRNLDRDTGRILDLLQKLGIDKDTLVLFTSDNGPHQEGGHQMEFFASNGKLRGLKRDLTEGGIRVPMIAWWPGVIAPGSANDKQWYVGDLLTTAAELAGVAPPAGLDSDSLVPAFRGQDGDDKWKRKSPLYWETYERGSAQAVRFGKWKALRAPMFTGELQLYDMSNDLGEKTNYALRRPDLAKHAANLLNKHHQPDPNWKVPDGGKGQASATDAVFQYAAQVEAARKQSPAFLWIPPDAKQVRGVVMAGMTLAERELVKDPQVRKVCTEQQLALVFVKTGLASVDVPKLLDQLGELSGYRELAVAPVFFVGHSAGGPQAKAAAVKHHERCFGVMQYRGGHPGGEEPVPPGVPALMMLGQFDEFGLKLRDDMGRENWENGHDALAAFRAQHAGNLGSIVIEPGAGHFAWSDRSAAYFALFLRQAARARIPDWPLDAKTPVVCKAIDPATGWLAELPSRTPGHKPAPFAEYRGEKASAGWHFGRELAEATGAYHQGLVGKKDQFLRWTDPHSVEAGARRYFNEVKWVGDGQTFEVNPIYAAAYPTTSKDGKVRHWALAGQPVGQSKSPVKVRPVGGPVVAVGANTFRIRYDALAPANDPGRVTFLAYSEGDADYRYTELVGMMPRGFTGLTAGKEQTITFPPVPNLKVGAGPVELQATSDSGLPVEYHVAYGPAVVENGKLRIAELPAQARFPVEVRVVAYQFGSSVEPRVKTAVPVERTLRIEKP